MRWDRYSPREVQKAAKKWGWRYNPSLGRGGHAALVHDVYPTVVMPALGRKAQSTHPSVLRKLCDAHGVSVDEFMAGPPSNPFRKQLQRESAERAALRSVPNNSKETPVAWNSLQTNLPKSNTFSYAILEAASSGARNADEMEQYFYEQGVTAPIDRHKLTTLMRLTANQYAPCLTALDLEFVPNTSRERGRSSEFRYIGDNEDLRPRLPRGHWVKKMKAAWHVKPSKPQGNGEKPDDHHTIVAAAPVSSGRTESDRWHDRQGKTAHAASALASQHTLFERIGVTDDNRMLVRDDQGKIWVATLEAL